MTTREKAIQIAIRYHFCGVDSGELEIYEKLQNWVDDQVCNRIPFCDSMRKFPDAEVWLLYEEFSSESFLDMVDNLIFDIENNFPA